MLCGTHRSGGGSPVEPLGPARSGPVRRPGGACYPLACKQQKGAAMSIVGVTGGVDTHADVHVAAAVDHNGGWLGVESFPANLAGYESLVGWLAGFGPISRIGVEGTGSWGVGLARFLGD